MQEVVRLEQHVAELGVREAGLEPRLHRLLLKHHVHREVLPDVAQEVDEPLGDEPFGVVEQQRGALAGAELEEPRHLIALALEILADLLLGEQRPLARLARRIADEAGAAAHQHDRPVAVAL